MFQFFSISDILSGSPKKQDVIKQSLDELLICRDPTVVRNNCVLDALRLIERYQTFLASTISVLSKKIFYNPVGHGAIVQRLKVSFEQTQGFLSEHQWTANQKEFCENDFLSIKSQIEYISSDLEFYFQRAQYLDDKRHDRYPHPHYSFFQSVNALTTDFNEWLARGFISSVEPKPVTAL